MNMNENAYFRLTMSIFNTKVGKEFHHYYLPKG